MKIIFDTETLTTPDDESIKGDIMIQLGCIIEYNDKITSLDSYFRPEEVSKMSPSAMKVHKIVPEDLTYADSIENSKTLKKFSTLLEKSPTLVGFNIDFDIQVLERSNIKIDEDVKYIDMYRVMMFISDNSGKLFDELNLEYLVYLYRLDKLRIPMLKKLGKTEGDIVVKSHDALIDVIDTYNLMRYIKSKYKIDDDTLLRISMNPLLLKKVPFGIHKGKLFSDLTTGQLEYMCENSFDEVVRFSACKHL